MRLSARNDVCDDSRSMMMARNNSVHFSRKKRRKGAGSRRHFIIGGLSTDGHTLLLRCSAMGGCLRNSIITSAFVVVRVVSAATALAGMGFRSSMECHRGCGHEGPFWLAFPLSSSFHRSSSSASLQSHRRLSTPIPTPAKGSRST